MTAGIVQRRVRMATEPVRFQDSTSWQQASAEGLGESFEGRHRTATAAPSSVQQESPLMLAKSGSLGVLQAAGPAVHRFIDEGRIEAHRRLVESPRVKPRSTSGAALMLWAKAFIISFFTVLYWFLIFCGFIGILAGGTVLLHHTLWHPEFGKRPVFENAAVATEQEICSRVGVQVLQQGGNAVDAAIASLLCTGVINNFSSGLIGGGFFLIRMNSTFSTVIDYRETAPAAVKLEDYMGHSEALVQGGMSVATPSQIKGIAMAHQRYGKLAWADLFLPAINIAKEGFTVTPKLAAMIHKCASNILKSPVMRDTYMKEEDLQDHKIRNSVWIPKAVGERIVRPALARTLERIAKEGAEAFWTGPIPKAIVEENRRAGGRLSCEDIAGYEAIERVPLVTHFHNFTLTTVGAPASGAVLAYVLGLLEGLDLQEPESPKDKHLFIETLKFGYGWRALLGDPEFATDMPAVEAELLSAALREKTLRRLDRERTHEPAYYARAHDDIHDRGTTQISVLAADGSAVSLTDTLNLEFGSGVADPVTGSPQNNEMGDFSLPGTPNVYGLPPSKANYVAAGKRPVSSSTPIILERDGQVVLVTGAAGGSRIISVTAQVVADLILYRLDPITAMTRPRFHHQLFPNEILVDHGAEEAVLEDLIKRGHQVKVLPPGTTLTSLQMILWRRSGEIWALSDPRKGGLADGY